MNIIKLLSKDIKPPLEYKDHSLKGYMNNIRECHIENDCLLLYKKSENILYLYLMQTGSYADIFEK